MHSTNLGALTGSIFQRISICGQAVKESLFSVQLIGKFRRFYLVHFSKSYVRRQLFYRTGECNQCGMCCALLFTCPMLTQQGLCLVYGKCRPQTCKNFPIDQRDIEEVSLCGGNCGYRFENRSLKKLK